MVSRGGVKLFQRGSHHFLNGAGLLKRFPQERRRLVGGHDGVAKCPLPIHWDNGRFAGNFPQDKTGPNAVLPVAVAGFRVRILVHSIPLGLPNAPAAAGNPAFPQAAILQIPL